MVWAYILLKQKLAQEAFKMLDICVGVPATTWWE